MSSAVTGGSNYSYADHENKAYLLIDRDYPQKLRDLFSMQRLGFTYLPEEINHSGAEPTYNDIEIVGRWAPYQVYQNTSAEEFSFTLQFFAYVSVQKDVVDKVNFLRSLKYPVSYGGISYRPPKVLFVFGDLIAKMCIVKEATPVYRAPWEVNQEARMNTFYDKGGHVQQQYQQTGRGEYALRPMSAECSVTLGVVSDISISGGSVSFGRDNLVLQDSHYVSVTTETDVNSDSWKTQDSQVG